MESGPKRVNIDELFSLGDDLIGVLNEKRETDSLVQCLEGVEGLRSSWEAEFREVQSSTEGFHKKIEVCKQKLDEAKNGTVADAELECLRNELEEELRRESLLHEELSQGQDW